MKQKGKLFFKMTTLVKFFTKEYVSNVIVANFPFIKFRMWFYRKILNISLDSSVFIQMGCYIYNSGEQFHIGRNTIINRKCVLDRRGGLFIGSNVNISSEVAIYTAGHDPQSSIFADFVKSVIIEDYVWIGTRAMIMPGIKIGKGAFILPGAVVTKDVESHKIVGGIPATVVGERTSDLRYRLLWRPWFT